MTRFKKFVQSSYEFGGAPAEALAALLVAHYRRPAAPRPATHVRSGPSWWNIWRTNWRAMARQGVAEARGLLRAVLVGRFVLTPVTPPPGLPTRKGAGRKPFHLRVEGEGVTLRTYRGVNFCKFDGGPNGIRTRVPTPPHAFASEFTTCGALSQ